MKMMIDTHKAIKELQSVDFTEAQAEKIVALQIQGRDEILNRFDKLESMLEKKFEKIDERFNSIAIWIGLGFGWITLIIGLHAYFGK